MTMFQSRMVAGFVGLIGLVSAQAGFGANWANGKNGNWSDTSANGWSGAYPNAPGAVAAYGSANNASTTQDVAGGVTIGTLQATMWRWFTWTIATNAANNPITFQVASGNALITVADNDVLSVYPPLIVNSPLVITNNSVGSYSTVNLYGSISSTQSIVVAPYSGGTSPGAINIWKLNTSGPLILNEVTNSTGAATVNFGGGALSGPISGAVNQVIYQNLAGASNGLIVSADNSSSFAGRWVLGSVAGNDYGYVQYNSTNAIGGSGRNVQLGYGGIAVAGYPIDQAFVNRVNTNSFNGSIAMADGTSSSNNLDYTGFSSGGEMLGAVGTATYTGVITPDSGNASAGYYLGGGGGTLILPNANVLTGSRGLKVGNDYCSASRQGVVLVGNTNNFTGVCTIADGCVLRTPYLANGGQPSGIGMSPNAAANLDLYGTLDYTGPGASIDRSFTLDIWSYGGTILANGSGPLKFTNTGGINVSTKSKSQVLSLGGTNTGDNTFSLSMGDGAPATNSLTKFGSGTWVITNRDTYSGATIVSGGVLRMNGILTTSAVAVVGGTLAGIGTISNSVTVTGATLAPGNPTVGVFRVGRVALDSNSTFAVTLTGNAAGQYSQLMVTNSAALGNAALTVNLGYIPVGPAKSNTLTIVHSGGLSGQFACGSKVTANTGYKFAVTYTGTDVILSPLPAGSAIYFR